MTDNLDVEVKLSNLLKRSADRIHYVWMPSVLEKNVLYTFTATKDVFVVNCGKKGM